MVNTNANITRVHYSTIYTNSMFIFSLNLHNGGQHKSLFYAQTNGISMDFFTTFYLDKTH